MSIYLGPAPGQPLPPSAFEIVKDKNSNFIKRLFCYLGFHKWIIPPSWLPICNGDFRYCFRCSRIEMFTRNLQLPEGYSFDSGCDDSEWIEVTKVQADYYTMKKKERFEKEKAYVLGRLNEKKKKD